jgi:hypothetical protein
VDFELAPLLTPTNVKRFRRMVSLTIDGYAEDPRDLYIIDEVREWVRLLDIAFPFWLYFADLRPESVLRWWPLCLCSWRQVPGGKLIEPTELRAFVTPRLQAVHRLCMAREVPQATFEATAREAIAFYGLQS